MRPEKLDQRAVKKGVDDRADPDDHPYTIPGDQAEYDTCQHTYDIRGNPCKMKRDLTFRPFLKDERYAVVWSDPHLCHHIKGDAQPCKETAEDQHDDPERKRRLHMEHILHKPADKIRSVPDTYHIYDRPRADASADGKENDDQDRDVHNELPCAEAHSDITADPEIHACERVHSEAAEAVTAYTYTDKKNPRQHHGAPFDKISSGIHFPILPAALNSLDHIQFRIEITAHLLSGSSLSR